MTAFWNFLQLSLLCLVSQTKGNHIPKLQPHAFRAIFANLSPNKLYEWICNYIHVTESLGFVGNELPKQVTYTKCSASHWNPLHQRFRNNPPPPKSLNQLQLFFRELKALAKFFHRGLWQCSFVVCPILNQWNRHLLGQKHFLLLHEHWSTRADAAWYQMGKWKEVTPNWCF